MDTFNIVQDIYDKGFSAMEKSHQRTLMEMRRTHRQELDRVRQEKDQLLKEEADATQAGFHALIFPYVLPLSAWMDRGYKLYWKIVIELSFYHSIVLFKSVISSIKAQLFYSLRYLYNLPIFLM